MTKKYNGFNSIKIDLAKAGICKEDGLRFTDPKCTHATQEQIEYTINLDAQIDEENRMKKVYCYCFEIAGDNSDCPKHGDIHRPFSDAEIKADYQERSDLYNMGMGA